MKVLGGRGQTEEESILRSAYQWQGVPVDSQARGPPFRTGDSILVFSFQPAGERNVGGSPATVLTV